MSEKIFTLFGEEIIPEPAKTAVKSKPVKNKDDKKENRPEGSNAESDSVSVETAVSIFMPAQEETATVPDTADVLNETTDAAIPKEEKANSKEPIIAVAQVVETPESKTATASTEDEADVASLPAPAFELPEDWKGDKQYYTIGEVAALFQVKTSHIRFWTNEFNLKVRTTRKGDRLYTAAQIRELKTINQLVKERGYTINGAKSKLKATKKIDITAFDLKLALLQLKTDLLTMRNQLS